jgi:ubiquinone/menaquinone biosynthesis C-methylase UbiE
VSATHPFRCPECPAADDSLVLGDLGDGEGVYVCGACGAWFPVEEAIADFCPPGARDDARWTAFWERHGGALRLRPPEVGDVSVNAQTQREFFDGFVGEYERIVATTSFWQAHDSIAIGDWARRVDPTADMLDLGAGSGRCTIPLAARIAPGSELVSIDISFEMLRESGRKLRELGHADRVRLVAGDCTDLGFLRSDRFDVAVAYGLLHHLDDPEPVWVHLDRVMRERANVLVHDNNATVLRRAFDALMRRRQLWDAEHEGHPVIALNDLRRWATSHGFQLHVRTSVFVPPHLCNRLSVAGSRRLLTTTDDLLGRVPKVAGQGGLVLAEAFRGGSPVALATSAPALAR